MSGADGVPPGPPRRRPPPPTDEDWADLARGTQQTWLRDRLARALATLPAEDERIVRLHVVDGWEVDVVAEDVGRPPGEVRRVLRRALRALRQQLLCPDPPEPGGMS